ncbi:MAG TPA: DUF1287 domain-containing protein [Terriglobales bacterium]|nr:DUF1287 domain-containing protein [Terriglobales bacterium]
MENVAPAVRRRLSVVMAALALLLSAAAAQQARHAPRPAREEFLAALVAAANDRPNHPARYEPKYVAIPYPSGDVPADTGVCADEIVRVYRAAGVDLQKLVHEDMKRAWADYPRKWGARRPDRNIDHRRVPNLQVFFRRHGESLAITQDAKDYAPGDIVTWNLLGKDGELPHIGMVVDQRGPSGRWMVEHNIGAGPEIADVLFDWPVTGHYRYLGR